MPANTPNAYLTDRTLLSVSGQSWVFGNAWLDTTPTNIERGLLFPYNRSLGIYRCPADRATVLDQGKLRRTRSVSMNSYMNPEPNPENDLWYRRCWHRLGQIRNPGPAQAAVFVDEHANSIQQGLFTINAPNYFTLFDTPLWTWVSFPATRHGNAGTVSFADGHAEVWRWREPNTLQISRKTGYLVPQRAVPNTDRDLGRFFRAIPEEVPIR